MNCLVKILIIYPLVFVTLSKLCLPLFWHHELIKTDKIKWQQFFVESSALLRVRIPRGSCLGVWMSGFIWSRQHWLLHKRWLLRLQCGEIVWTCICRSLWKERSDTQLPLPSIIPVWRTCTVGGGVLAKHSGRWGFEVKDGLPHLSLDHQLFLFLSKVPKSRHWFINVWKL